MDNDQEIDLSAIVEQNPPTDLINMSDSMNFVRALNQDQERDDMQIHRDQGKRMDVNDEDQQLRSDDGNNKLEDDFWLDGEEFQESINPADKIGSEDQEQQEAAEVVASKAQQPQVLNVRIRDEQWDLFQNSIDKNAIIFLPTGSGKTLVSIMAMHYYLSKFGKDKKIIFLANTIQLVKQQAESVKKYLPRVGNNNKMTHFIRNRFNNKHHQIRLTQEEVRDQVVCLHGEKADQMGMTKRKMIQSNNKDHREIVGKIQKGVIIVMISQMFLNCLRRGYIKLSQCMLIVFDECHHCNKEHPYKNIMDEFYFEAVKEQKKLQEYGNVPIIMGLTASPGLDTHKNLDCIQKQVKTLCNNLDSCYSLYTVAEQGSNKALGGTQKIEIKQVVTDDTKDETVPDLISNFAKLNNMPDILDFTKRRLKKYFPPFFLMLNDLDNEIKAHANQVSRKANILFGNLISFLTIKVIDVWLELGSYATFLLLQDVRNQFVNDFKLERQPDKTVKEGIDEVLTRHLQIFQSQFGYCEPNNISQKVLKLIEIIKKQQEGPNKKMVLVFVYERRIVRYLQKLLTIYTSGLDISDDLKDRLKCKGVTGASDSRNREKGLKNEELTQNPTDYSKEKSTVNSMFAQNFRHEIQDFNDSIGASGNMKNEKIKKDSRMSKEFVDPSQKHSSQIQTISDFRRGEFSILLSTSVTEQGFDIPDCNLVISFNPPNQLKSFVQIKGRARKVNSKYFILEYEQYAKKMEKEIKQYTATITSICNIAIRKLARNNYQPTPPQINRYYMSWKVPDSDALINTNNSLDILMSFVNTYRGRNLNKLYKYFFRVPQSGYICYIKFHDGFPIDIVKGNIGDAKKTTLKSAAFIAVVQLYKKGYIKSDLKPKGEADLYGEIELEKVNDLEIMREDQSYSKIMIEFARVQEDLVVKKAKFHFKSLKNKDFDFHKINPEFDPVLFKTTPFKFQLYRINISNNNKMLKTGPGANTGTEISLGLLTGFRSCDTQTIFTNFRYGISGKLNENYKIQEVESSIILTLEEYTKLRRVHDFLVYGCTNHQLIALSKKGAPSIRNWISKVQTKKYDADDRQFYPLFVMLQADKKTKKMGISHVNNTKVVQYSETIQKIYQFNNAWQKNKYKNERLEFPVSLNGQINSFSEDMGSANEKYIVQSITPDFMMHKCVVLKVNNLHSELPETVTKQLEAKREKLKKMYPHSKNPEDKLIKVAMLRKKVKYQLGKYLKPDDTVHASLEQVKQYCFRSEFIKYPVDLQFFIQLKLSLDFVLPKVQDYSRAYHFRNIFLRGLETRGLQAQKHCTKKYEFNSPLNMIYKNLDSIRTFMQTKDHLREKALILTSQPRKYTYPIQRIIKKVEEGNLNTILEVSQGKDFTPTKYVDKLSINEILKGLTSRIYKSDKNQNYEQYQFMGDCVLKLLATIQVFIDKNEGDEGDLHIGRSRIISNSNLHTISIRHKLFQYILTRKAEEPPAPLKMYYDTKSVVSEEYKSTGVLKVNSASQQEGFSYVPVKTHADVIQALIGIYYFNNNEYNLDACQFFLYSMGVLQYPTLKLEHTMENPPKEKEVEYFAEVQNRLAHKFRNKNLLIQAFTHKSFESVVKSTCQKQLTQMKKKLTSMSQLGFLESNKQVYTSGIKRHEFYYERLEFLGDAVLDLVAVEYIYEKEKGQLMEGAFSNMKQASVSNKTLGLVALFWGFDEFILIDHKDSVGQFGKLRAKFNSLFENPQDIYTTQAAPLKILGDVFQSYVGAVFLDSDFDYQHTRAICRRLLVPFIDHFTSPSIMALHPQFRFKEHLKSINVQDIRVRLTDKPIIAGKFQYALVDRANIEISTCREYTLKKAEDKLIEMYVMGLKGVSVDQDAEAFDDAQNEGEDKEQ